jgi:hypothetical protein
MPTWGGTGGATGTGATKQITFNTTSTNTSDYKTVIAGNPTVVTVNVIVYEVTGILTPDDDFPSRSQTRLGIAERAFLDYSVTPSISAQQIGNFTWIRVSGSGTVNSNLSGSGTFVAANVPGMVTLKLEIGSGPSKGLGPTQTRDVIVPNGGIGRQAPNTRVGHTFNKCSVAFALEPYLLPTDVSFSQLGFMEGTALARTTPRFTGYYWALEGFPHTIQGPDPISQCNILFGCKADFVDQPNTNDNNPPCSTGDLTWAIPWQYVLGSNPATATTFYTAIHYQYNIPTNSIPTDAVSIEKAGVGPFTMTVGHMTVPVF